MSDLTRPYFVSSRNNGSSITLYDIDCLEGMNGLIEENSVDIVVTSPPYNIGMDYGKFKDNLPQEEYLAWLELVGIEIKKVLNDDGSFFLNMGNKPSNQWMSIDAALRMRNHFVLQNKIQWTKSIFINKLALPNSSDFTDGVTIGHYQPLSPRCLRFLNNCYEDLYHFTKEGNVRLDKLAIGVPYQDKSNIKRWSSINQDLRDRGNVWLIPYKTIQSKDERPHPATFPVELADMCISLHGKLNSKTVVFDPFCGMGSSAVAAIDLGVSFVGFDINKEYLDITIRRLSSG